MKRRQNKHQHAAHVCKECGASHSATGKPFTAISLKYHQVKAHPRGPKEAPVACVVCGRSRSALGKPFTRATLLMHQAKCHPEPSAAGKPLVEAGGNGDGALRCDQCGTSADRKGRAFRDQASLGRHRRAAHGRIAPASAPVLTSLIAPGAVILQVVSFCPVCGCDIKAVHLALAPTGPAAAPASSRVGADEAGELSPVRFCPACACNLEAMRAAISAATAGSQ